MIKIGYVASGPALDYYSSLAHHPTFHPVREEIPVRGRALRCPAFNEYCQSAFNIHVPYDLKFRIKRAPQNKEPFIEYDRSQTSLDEEGCGHALALQDLDDGVAQLSLHPFFMFLSDTPDVIMTVLGAQGQTNPEPIRGQFNIYNWFRGTSYAFKVEEEKWYTISRSSPIYQVKFYHPSETHFLVAEALKTPFLDSRESGQRLHGMIGPQKWPSIFDFNKKRRPKKVIQFLNEFE